jgi:two-component system response regulator YesN
MKIVQKYRGKIILRRIFAVCFGLAAVCILLSCILGFGWFRVSQIQQQESDYESRMDTYVLVLQNYGKSMENVVTVLENDVYIRKLINRNTFTWDNTAGIAAQEVTNLVSVNPMIHSVYVWLEDDYLIKSTNPSYPIDQNGDARMLDIFQMSTFHESAVIPYLDIYGKSQNLLCLTSGSMDPTTGGKRSGIQVNMDLDKIMTSTLPKTEEEQFLLIDRDGNIVYEQGTREMYRVGERLEDILWKNRNLTETSAEIVRTAQGRFLSVATEIDDEFTLVWLISYRHLTGSMTRVGFLFLGIGLLVAIIVLLLALLMSNRVYNPIGEMVRTASEEGLPSEAMARQLENTELYSIAQTYQTMVQRLNHINLRKEQEDLAAYLISREKTAKLPEWVEEIYAKPGVRIRVVVMRLSDIQDLHSNNTEEAIAFEMETIKTIVEQTLRELGNVLVLPVDREFIAVILFSEESVTEERVTVASQHILEVTGELIHIGMDVGISGEKGETEGFAELNLMYQMARAATAYRFIYGMGAVVTEGEMAQREQAPSSEELIQRLRQSDRTGFSAEYRRIVGELKKLSIQKAQDALMEIAGQMQTYRNSLQYRFEPLTKKDYEVLAGQLASYEYMDDAEDWFFRMAEEIWLILERNRQTGREDVVEKAIAYLQSNYGDPNISAQYLADKYHITPSYFSRLFHEKCGCTFPDYLVALRIERARELLLERENLSIQEICELVGYSNASYFTTSFKKKYGMTPGQFRRSQH